MHDVAACTDKGHCVLDHGNGGRCCLVVEVEGMQNLRAFIGQGQTAVAQARREDVSTLAVRTRPVLLMIGGLTDEGVATERWVQLEHAFVHGLGAKQVEFDLCEAIGIGATLASRPASCKAASKASPTLSARDQP